MVEGLGFVPFGLPGLLSGVPGCTILYRLFKQLLEGLKILGLAFRV